jgi:hypothetical protein
MKFFGGLACTLLLAILFSVPATAQVSITPQNSVPVALTVNVSLKSADFASTEKYIVECSLDAEWPSATSVGNDTSDHQNSFSGAIAGGGTGSCSVTLNSAFTCPSKATTDSALLTYEVIVYNESDFAAPTAEASLKMRDRVANVPASTTGALTANCSGTNAPVDVSGTLAF